MALPEPDRIYDVIISTAILAGEMILAANTSPATLQIKKNSADPVTETDKAVERMIHDTLLEEFPEFDFMGEESYKAGASLTDKPTFIVDPIDGTTNFVHTYPAVCVSIGLCLNKKPIAGVVHNPFTGVLWSAYRGKGAFVRSVRPTSFTGLSTEPQRLPLRQPLPPLEGLRSALTAVEWGSDRDGPNWHARVQFFSKLGGSTRTGGGMVHGFRSSGSAALNFCAVASGQLDVCWEAGAWAWDVCAAWAILEEAGGKVVDANPKLTAQTWEGRAPSLEGRTYLGVRAATSEEQQNVVEEIWRLVETDFIYG